MDLRQIAALLVAASPAIAMSAPRWDAWVGDYQGNLVWRRCTAPGEKVAVLAIDAVDGAIRIDLSPIGAALGTFSLQHRTVGAGTMWEAQDGDLEISVRRRQPDTIELAITYASGCTARGRLTRATTGVPACDALLGWARIEAACTKASDKLEAAARTTKWKQADAARCTARADKLAHAMVEAGCAPHPDPQIGTRAAACGSLSEATAKLARCGRVPPEIMQRLSTTARALAAAAQTAEPATLGVVERQCQDARAEVTGTAVQFQCRL